MPTLLPYNRQAALDYARRFSRRYNPDYISFAGIGGDCTNFVSQCVYAGSGVMNYTPTFGWYYISSDNRAPAWTGVNEFYNFITQQPDFIAVNGGIGPFGEETAPENLMVGDVIQLSNEAGIFYHSLLVTAIRFGRIYVSAHSYDAYNRPLNRYSYSGIRGIHILGVNAD